MGIDIKEYPPNIDFKTIEISVIGTGGGYGESIILHLGNNNWIIVDSCIDPYSKEVLPLSFLKNRKIELSNVKYIICTHWHDDHIQGISDILRECTSASFFMSAISDQKKFLQFVKLDSFKALEEPSISSTIEIGNCFKILAERDMGPKSAFQDRTLFFSNENNIESEVIALSPSDYVFNKFAEELSELINRAPDGKRKFVYESPNDKSVVLLVCVNDQNILLGSDLEVSTNTQKGWICILDESTKMKGKKADIFKLPHHGSKTGYDERIWNEIVKENAISKLTPWNRNTKLPQKGMVELYFKHSENIYITSPLIVSSKPKKRDNAIDKTIKMSTVNVREIKYRLGIITSQLNLSSEDKVWKTTIYGTALKITRELLDKI